MSRNKKLHENIHFTGKQIVDMILMYEKEYMFANERSSLKPVMHEDWYPLTAPCVKINFDASFWSRSARSALGVVAHNSEGRVLAIKQMLHTHVASAFAAEGLACVQVVRMGIERGFENVIIKGDARSIIKKCKNGCRDKSGIFSLIQDIHRAK